MHIAWLCARDKLNIKEDGQYDYPLFDFCIFIHFILFTIIKFKNSERIKTCG